MGDYIGTAGWNIPREHAGRFPAVGSQLQRYAARLNAAEINTSFYRPHAVTTYQRWGAAVPPDFRFAVKVPKVITHERGLTRAREPLERFLAEIAGLEARLGPLLVQLPPSHAFDARRAGRFFELLRARHAGPVVCEPRHVTWTSPPASRLLVTYEIARVAADPPRAGGLREPGGWPGLVYLSVAWVAARVLLALHPGAAARSCGQAVRGHSGRLVHLRQYRFGIGRGERAGPARSRIAVEDGAHVCGQAMIAGPPAAIDLSSAS